ncbi:hypothetical protein CTAYLR_006598 [Chrysophaeum taylorii]|uniref:Tyrosine specific protein phosphatases domain-containing protein n=1 Tax=Chrysophaeum taylorii TaxID=2483200 RepID=A0AAD7UM84_9STRA|nr:hypothetical protein CTAYLR_006598 [Chrysophaeum taylorii]
MYGKASQRVVEQRREVAEARLVPEEAKWSSVPKKAIKGVFDNVLLTLDLQAGADGKNAVVRGWKDPIAAHDAAVEQVEVQMRVVDVLRKELKAKKRMHRNWETAWHLSNERPEELDEFLQLRPKMGNFRERVALMKKTEDKVKAEQEWKLYHEIKSKCERLLEARDAFREIAREKDEAFERMKAADQQLETLVEIETEKAENISEDHAYADERGEPISELFVGVKPGVVLTEINGTSLRELPWGDIEELVQRSRRPHSIQFERYDYRYSPLRGVWESVEVVRSRGRWVEDPRASKELFCQYCRDGDASAVRRALEEGMDVGATDATLCTGLHHAAAKDRVGAMEVLLAANASIEARNANKQTPLLSACRCGTTDAATLLLNRGASVDARDGDGRTAFVLSVQSGNIEMLEILLNLVQDPARRHAPDKIWGWTPLHHAAAVADAPMVALLLESGDASPYDRAKDQRRPLDLANNANVFALLDARIRGDPAQCVLERSEDSGELWLGSRHAAYPKFAADRRFDAILSVFDRATKDAKLEWLASKEDDDCCLEHHELCCNLQKPAVEDDRQSWCALAVHLRPAIGFLDDALKRERTVLVHCDLGETTSFAVVLAYMITKRRVRLKDAVARLAGIRRCLVLTPSFEAGLADLECEFDKRKLQRLEARLRDSPVLAL